MQIVGSRPVRALFFPEDEAEPVQELAYFLRRRDIPFVQLSHTTDHTVWRLGEHIRLQAFRTQHLGQEFYEVPHVCYRISFDGHMRESVRRRLTAPGAEHLRVLPLSEPYQQIKL